MKFAARILFLVSLCACAGNAAAQEAYPHIVTGTWVLEPSGFGIWTVAGAARSQYSAACAGAASPIAASVARPSAAAPRPSVG